jgi:hypothetical protein
MKTKMNKINLNLFLMTIVISILTSCMTTTKIANYKISPIENENIDSTIVIRPNTGRVDGFCFTIENLSSEPIFIDWDKSFLLLNGKSYRCIHAGVRFMEKSAPQVQTPVGPYSTLSDCLFPIDNIYMDDVYQGWMQKPLQSKEGRYSIAILQNGKESNLQGNFIMTEEDTEVPMHSMSSTNASASGLMYISAILLLISSIALLL